jgi:pimeloyl-ACP methyl ester carboxylesterase
MPESGQGSILILGGFLSRASYYREMKNRIADLSGQAVHIVDVSPTLWLAASFPHGWSPILKRLEPCLNSAHLHERTRYITLVGHSLGGVLGYLYLMTSLVEESGFKGGAHINHLITLGSPYVNHCRWLHGGLVSKAIRKLELRYSLQASVRLTSVVGKSVHGDPKGKHIERRAYRMYKNLAGEGAVWGDGIIPVSAASLPHAQSVILEDVGHLPRREQSWYGSADVIPQWWPLHPSHSAD